jgi:hypothetical protein
MLLSAMTTSRTPIHALRTVAVIAMVGTQKTGKERSTGSGLTVAPTAWCSARSQPHLSPSVLSTPTLSVCPTPNSGATTRLLRTWSFARLIRLMPSQACLSRVSIVSTFVLASRLVANVRQRLPALGATAQTSAALQKPLRTTAQLRISSMTAAALNASPCRTALSAQLRLGVVGVRTPTSACPATTVNRVALAKSFSSVPTAAPVRRPLDPCLRR